jgi:hypothetical protein
MTVENEGESKRYQHKPHQAEPQQGRPADTPLVPFPFEQQGREERSHEEWVASFQSAILQEKRKLGDLAKYHSPANIVHSALSEQVQYIFSNENIHKQRGEFFAPILHAWEITAYEYYGKGSLNSGDLDRHYAGLSLCTQYQRAKARNSPHPEIIRLSEPTQIKILDAAAAAVGIPHQQGQSAFKIPQNLWDYRAQVHQANEAWRRRPR